MAQSEDFRALSESRDVVAAELRYLLLSQGYTIAESRTEPDSLFITANKPASSPWASLMTNTPPLEIYLILLPDKTTGMRLQATSTPDLRRLVIGLLAVIFIILEGAYWIIQFVAPRKNIVSLGACAFCAIFGCFTVAFWGLLLSKLLSFPSFSHDLYTLISQNLGVEERVIRMRARHPEVPKALALSLAIMIVLLVPAWRLCLEHPLVILVGGGFLAGLIYAVFGLVKHKVSGGNYLHCIVNLYGVVTIGFYGLFPIAFLLCFIAVFEGVRTDHPERLSALHAAIFTIVYIIFSALWLGTPLVIWARDLTRLANYFAFAKRHTERTVGGGSRRLANFTFFLLWVSGSAVGYLGLYTSLSLIELCLTSRSRFLPFLATRVLWYFTQALSQYWAGICGSSHAGYWVADVALFSFALPIPIWFLFIFTRNIRSLIRYSLDRLNRKVRPLTPAFVFEENLLRLCRFAGVAPPFVRLHQSGLIYASVEIPPLPGLRSALEISSGAITQLAPAHLEALLAHEVGHLKERHTSALAIINMLSRWTLVGEGFLSAWIHDSTQLESEADLFAITWMESKKRSRMELVELLQILEQQRISVGLCKMTSSDGSRLAILNNDHEIESWQQITTRCLQFSRIERLKRLIRLQCSFYFFGWQATYLYLPYQQRIDNIKRMLVPNTRSNEC